VIGIRWRIHRNSVANKPMCVGYAGLPATAQVLAILRGTSKRGFSVK
jgi:hypothetical protein